jgi:hypothetical protein
MKSIAARLTLSLVVTLGLLGAAEVLLQVLRPGLDEVVSPLIYQQNSGQAFTAGSAPGSRVYVSGRRRVATNKVAGKRILILGASAAYGEMYTAFSAFSGQMQESLRQAAPDTAIEVLNLAHGGMGSRQVGEMLFRILENDRPDLVVIYTGNNEYHELRALKARSDRYDPRAELLRRRLSKSYLYRTLREYLVPSENTLAPPDGIEWLPVGRMDVQVDDADRELGQLLYGEHLRNMILAAQKHDVPIVITTVASNLRDHIDQGTPGTLSQEGERALHSLGEMVDQVSPARFAAQVGKKTHLFQTEGGQYRLGQLFLRAGLNEAAHHAFETKELLALRPMTSNRALRTVARKTAQKYDVPFCDLAEALAAASTDGIPGNDVFVDHCHPNAAGHSILGKALSQCILAQDLLDLGVGKAPDSTAKADPFRIDHFQGHRPIPGIQAPTTNTKPNTPEATAEEGHKAFVEDRFDLALQRYQNAEEQGGEAGSIQMSIGLTHLFRGDLLSAKTALQRSIESGNTDARRTLETLTP